MENGHGKEVVTVQPERSALTAADLRQQVNLIQEVMQAVMKDKEHYGVIPGCGKKPTLLKAGAEKLAMTFRLAPDISVEDLSTPDAVRYRVTVRLSSQSSGRFIGAGIGEASSDEEKYRWRAAVHQKEYDATAETRRREKFKYDGTSILQVRTNPADVANTILKMAKKRALVDAVLTATAASDIFTQDIEDMKEPVDEAPATNGHKEAPAAPKPAATEAPKAAEAPKAQAPAGNRDGIISDPQRKRLYAIRKSGNVSDEVYFAILGRFGVKDDRNILREDYDAIVHEVQAEAA